MRTGSMACALLLAAAVAGAAAGKETKAVEGKAGKQAVPQLVGGERVVAASGAVGAGMFPKLLKLPDGELVAVIRGGAPHIGVGGRLDLIRSTDGGRTWTKPTTMLRSSRDDRGPSVGLAADGTLVCMYRIYDAYDEQGKRKKQGIKQYTMLSLSRDRGRTWSKPSEVKLPPFAWLAPFQRMVRLADATLLMPGYGRLAKASDGHKAGPWALVVRSRDNGRTWGDITYMARGFNETALLPLPEGRLLAAMRGSKGGLATTASADQGRTWSQPRQVAAGRRYPADLMLLPSGHVLLVYGRRHPPCGLEARLSDDLGRTWGPPVALAWTATNADCGYPSGAVAADGTIVVLWYAVGSVADPKLGFHCEAIRFREEDLRKSLAGTAPAPAAKP